MQRPKLRPSLLLILAVLLLPIPVGAQGVSASSLTWSAHGLRWSSFSLKGSVSSLTWSAPATYSDDFDTRLLLHIHSWDGAGARHVLGAVDASFYPLTLGAPVAALGAAVFVDDFSTDDALLVSASWLGVAGSMFVLKRVFHRKRPYVAIPGVEARGGYIGTRHLNDNSSMPSGHAMLAASMATAASILYPKWYVVGPSVLWVGSVSTSRVWLGVHYPSDVIVGSLLGVAIATGVHFALK